MRKNCVELSCPNFCHTLYHQYFLKFKMFEAGLDFNDAFARGLRDQ